MAPKPGFSLGSSVHHRSILEVGKPNDVGKPFQVQLDEAFKILEVRPQVLASSLDLEVLSDLQFDPRCEWVVKWLLRSFGSRSGLESISSEQQAWLLFKFALCKLPLNKTLRLLKEHNLLTILKLTLEWLSQTIGSEHLLPDNESAGQIAISATFDPNHGIPNPAMFQGSGENHLLLAELAEKVPLPVFSLVHVVFSTVRLLQAYLDNSQRCGDEMISGRIGQVLLGPVDMLASILASSFHLLHRQIKKKRTLIVEDRVGVSDTKLFRKTLGSAIDLWDSGCLRTGESSKHLCYEAFTKQCLVPGLVLLLDLQKVVKYDGRDPVAEVLEHLIVSNVYQPLRESLQASKVNGDSDLTSFLEILKGSLQQVSPLSTRAEVSSELVPDSAGKKENTAVLLFEIIVREALGSPAKSRKEETPWLQNLFQLFVASIQTRDESADHRQVTDGLKNAFRNLLTKAHDFKLQVDSDTIRSILDRVSGLFTAPESDSNIPLISLCIKNNADVFVLPLDNGNIREHSEQSPNKYLLALLRVVTRYKCGDLSMNRENAQTVMRSLVIPLLDGFIEARDLLGFLENQRQMINQFRNDNTIAASELGSSGSATCWSIWELDSLTVAIADRIESNLSIDQIQILFGRIKRQLKSAANSGGNDNLSPGDFTLLECLLLGCHSETLLDSLTDVAKSTFQHLCDLLDSKASDFSSRWKIWRTLATIYRKWGKYDNEASLETPIQRAVSEASAIFDDIALSAQAISDYRSKECAFAFGFILSFVPHGSEKVDQITQLLIRLINKLFKGQDIYERIDAGANTWAVGYDGVYDVHTLRFSCVIQILQTRKALSCLDTETQNLLMRWTYQSALADTLSGGHSPIEYGLSRGHLLWEKFLESKDFAQQYTLRRNIWKFQIRNYVDLLGNAQVARQAEIDFAGHALLKIPSREMTREQRTSIADKLVNCGDHPRAVADMQSLDILYNCARSVVQSMDIFRQSKLSPKSQFPLDVANPSILFLLAEEYDKYGSEKMKLGASSILLKLNQKMLSFLCSDMQDESKSRILVDLLKSIGDAIGSVPVEADSNIAGWTSRNLTFTITTATFNFIHERREHLSAFLRSQLFDIDTFRLRLWQTLNRVTEFWFQEASNLPSRHHTALCIGCHYAYADVIAEIPGAPEQVCAKLASIVVRLQNANANDLHDFAYNDRELDLMLSKLRYKLSLARGISKPQEIFELLISVDWAVEAIHKEPLMQDDLIAMLDHDLLMQIVQSPQFREIAGPRDVNQLYLLRNMIYHIQGEISEGIRAAISTALSILLQTLKEQHEHRIYMIAMQCIDGVIHRLPRIVGQHHLDAILSSISIRGSEIASSRNTPHGEKIYIGLCRIYTSALVMHRPRIGGRYHLVISALQALLQCLFEPYVSTDLSKTTAPPQERSPAFGPTHARTYARLLATLCDPSPSAVSRSRKRSRDDLNDKTKHAKAITGQYMQYLIMTYCMCQLTGKLAHRDMREALQPGIWAALDCMSPEMLRMMNSSLTSDARAVWKHVYDEWQEFGKWKGN